jgi:hypothetical protein
MSRRPSLFNLTLAAFSRKPSTKSKSPLALSRAHGRTGSQSSTSGSSRASQDSSLQSEVSESTSTSASTEESVASDKPALPALALSSPVSLASDLPSTPRSGTPESDVLVTPVGAAVVRAWPAAKAAGAGVDADHVENHQTI